MGILAHQYEADEICEDIAKPLTLFSGFRGLPLKPKTALSLRGRGETGCVKPKRHSLFPISNSLSLSPAFTLAEILITLGTIGIVAQLTIPTLMGAVQEQVLKNRWKKAYSDLNNALELVKADEGIGTVNSYFSCTELYCMKPLVVKIIAKYKFATTPTSLKSEVTALYKSITGVQWQSSWAMFTEKFYDMNDTTIYVWYYHPSGASIWVDVNGYRNKPNVVGKDLFAAELKNGKMIPMGANITVSNDSGVGRPYSATGDWCAGNGKTLVADKQESYGVSPYAGIGCSAEYIYGNKK